MFGSSIELYFMFLIIMLAFIPPTVLMTMIGSEKFDLYARTHKKQVIQVSTLLIFALPLLAFLLR